MAEPKITARELSIVGYPSWSHSDQCRCGQETLNIISDTCSWIKEDAEAEQAWRLAALRDLIADTETAAVDRDRRGW